jgi:hypothetical protein
MKSEKLIRKLVSLPQSMWDDIGTYRAQERIRTEAEAVRRLLTNALKAVQGKGWSK